MVRTPRGLLDVLNQATGHLTVPEAAPPPQPDGLAALRHVARVRSLFDDDNVIGAGVAEKITEGRETGELSLVFYVRRKRAKRGLGPNQLIPQIVADSRGKAHFTDVVAVGDIKPQVNKAGPPLRSGFSIGHVDVLFGTLGALVRKQGKLFVLSNSHVLARSGLASPGDNILYPAPGDGGVDPRDVAATLHSFTPFVPGGAFVNTADAAIAEVVATLAGTAVTDLFRAATPLKLGTPRRGMKVVKRGRTSGDTESVVRDADFRFAMTYDGVGSVGFTGQVRCKRFTKDGDSGAIVVDKETGAIVGLHFAGSSSASVFTPIRTVVAALGIQF
jgi:hypothetical protein